MGLHTLHAADYAVFAGVVVVSLGIGVYHALSGGKQRTMSEYLVGGRKMTIIPVAISMMVSFESSITMLGMPAEGYVYGIQYLIGSLGYGAAIMLSVYFVVPVIHPLKLTSAYEYLELRFKSRLVRKLGSILGIINYIWYMGIVLFGPATALEAVTGFPQWGSIFLVAIAAMIYTSIGGIKAVIWTDVFQAFIMFAGLFAVLIKGTMDVGGPSEVWRRANEGGRNNLFNFDPDPTVRHTFWNLFIGKGIRGLSLVFNQSSIQRISSTRSKRDAMIVMFLMSPGFLITFSMAVMEGIVAYGYYDKHGCDPFESKQLNNANQIVPYMVMDIFRSLPGMPGLFLAALFSASLSTISSGLSSLSALTWKDFVQPAFPKMSESHSTMVAKLSVIVFGLMACGISVLVSLVGGPLPQLTGSLLSSFGGPLTGLFLVGSLTRTANAKGALAGAVVSFIITTWFSMGSSFSPHRVKAPWLPPASMDNCPSGLNTSAFHNTSYFTYNTTSSYLTTPSIEENVNEGPQGIDKMYLISYTWFYVIAVIICFAVCLPVSYFTAKEEDKPDPKYIVPLSREMWKCLPVSFRTRWCGYTEEEEAKKPSDSDDVYDTEIYIPARKRNSLSGNILLQEIDDVQNDALAQAVSHENLRNL